MHTDRVIESPFSPIATSPVVGASSSVFSSVKHERVPLTILSYEDFVRQDAAAIKDLKTALLEQGIVGIRGIPGYQNLVRDFIDKLRAFSQLDQVIKDRYAPNRSVEFLGYELGKEKFKRADGLEIIDKSKASYYALVPDSPDNKWPKEVNLREVFQSIGALMAKTGQEVMEKIGLLGSNSTIALDTYQVGRALSYHNQADSSQEKDDCWCGPHFDHGVFTALLPALYFCYGKQVKEPEEAGLFVQAANETTFKKVVADDPDVMYFQVGEFGQVATNDAIRATKHKVHRATGALDRYTMALFFAAKSECSVTSTSILAKDERYGKEASCTYKHWHEASLARYLAT